MKKRIVGVISLLILFALTLMFMFEKNTNGNLRKVKLAEVTHSIFYTPMYVAVSEGFLSDASIDLEIILTPGADKVTAAILSGDVDIGFAGGEAAIYVYNSGQEDYSEIFGQLTNRDGSFLVSRKKYDNFKLEDLKGKTIIGGRKGGMPEMTFEWTLRQNGVDPKKDVNIDTSIAFAAMQGAFIGGYGDFVTLFEPNALQVEKQGLGYVVASVGILGGEAPFTVFSAKKSFIEENKDLIKNFNIAINKGLKFVRENNEEVIAKSIYNFFPDTSMNDLILVIKRYKAQNTWNESTLLKEESFTHLQEIMISAKELEKTVPFKTLVNNQYN